MAETRTAKAVRELTGHPEGCACGTCLMVAASWTAGFEAALPAGAASPPGAEVSEFMQGVDCPYCEDGTPHTHVAPLAAPAAVPAKDTPREYDPRTAPWHGEVCECGETVHW